MEIVKWSLLLVVLVGLHGLVVVVLVVVVSVAVDCLDWWRQNAVILPAWAAAAKKVLVV